MYKICSKYNTVHKICSGEAGGSCVCVLDDLHGFFERDNDLRKNPPTQSRDTRSDSDEAARRLQILLQIEQLSNAAVFLCINLFLQLQL